VEAKEKAIICGRYADDKKAKDVDIIELIGLTDIADYFVLASGTSDRHVRTIAENIEQGLKQEGIRPFSVEGYDAGRWVIIDYQNVVVHVFLESLRELYDIESLWLEAKRYRLEKENQISEVRHGEEKT
jgi:ribosome-associated protein